jgi:hypothetical protein
MKGLTRGQMLALALGSPALVTALLLTVTEVWLLTSARSPIAPRAPSSTGFVDALRGRNVEEAFAFVRGGQDPNALLAVTDPVLTRGHTVRVRPLVLAVASDNENGVSMLLSNGVRLDLVENRRAACLADQLGFAGMATAIRGASPTPSSPESCPQVQPGEALLVPYAE